LQAVCELFVHPAGWRTVIAEQLIDFVWIRISKIGGIAAAIKTAQVAEAFGARTAWSGGGDNGPTNIEAAIQENPSCWNFGIQEEEHFRPEWIEAFPGTPVVDRGCVHPSGEPGPGVDLDEAFVNSGRRPCWVLPGGRPPPAARPGPQGCRLSLTL